MFPGSRRGTITTQTQNKTRQNYYAILPVYAGEAYVPITDIHISKACKRLTFEIITPEGVKLFVVYAIFF